MSFLESASPVSLRSIGVRSRLLVGTLILIAAPLLALGQVAAPV